MAVSIVPYHGYSALYIVFGCTLVLHLRYFIRNLFSVFTLKDLIQQYIFFVSAKFNLLNVAVVDLKNSSGVNVECSSLQSTVTDTRLSC